MTAVLFVSALLASSAALGQEPARLELEESFARPLPPGFELAGAAVGASGALVLWARNQSYLILQDGDRPEILRSGALARPVAAALVVGDSAVEVVDSGRERIVRLRRDGALVSERPLRLPISVATATRLLDGWVVAGNDSTGALRVHRLHPGEGASLSYSVDARAFDSPPPILAHLSSRGGRVFVTLVEPPFHVVALDATTAAVAFARDSLDERPEEDGREAPRWVSMPLFPLDRGYLRSFSDLRSDARLLVLYDDGGRRTRSLRINVPLGVLATDPGRSLLLAARRTDSLELVGYRWRWASPSEP